MSGGSGNYRKSARSRRTVRVTIALFEIKTAAIQSVPEYYMVSLQLDDPRGVVYLPAFTIHTRPKFRLISVGLLVAPI